MSPTPTPTPSTRADVPARPEILLALQADLDRYLSEAADHVTGLEGLRDVLSLDTGDLNRALAYRLVVSPEADRAVEAVDRILPSLPPRRERTTTEMRGYVRGNISWTRTAERQLSAGDPTLFVATVPEKRYDTNIARLVATVLDHLSGAVTRTRLLPGQAAERSTRLSIRYEWARRHLRHPKLAAARRRLTESELEQLELRPQLRPLTVLVRLHQALFERRDTAEILRAMTALVLAPRSTPTLYELYVAFRLVDAFEQRGLLRERPWRLLGSAAPLAVLTGEQIRVTVYWQRALSTLDTRASKLINQLARENEVVVGTLRPDIVVQVVTPDGTRLRFGEVKYYDDPARGASRGLIDALAYHADAGGLFDADTDHPLGFVVAAGVRSQPAPALVSVASDQQLAQIAELLLRPFEGNTTGQVALAPQEGSTA